MTPLIYIINGPNLNLLGQREPKIYGSNTLKDVEDKCIKIANKANIKINFLQSNAEHEIINWIHSAREEASGIIINPAAYSHTSIAILDALTLFDKPIIEVHISNIHKREVFRHNSYVTQRLWLTRRLLDRLIPSLTDQLEVNSTNKISKELEQSFEQEKAEINKTKTESVKLIKNNPSWLVTSVKVGKNSQEFKLLFIEDKIENENYQNKAEFVLAIPNLRQWLNALFKIYLKANWDTKFFPVWIDTDISLSEKKPILN